MVYKHYPRLLDVPRDSFFLFGARGTGKSTWARERLPDAHRIDLLDEGRYQELLADPSLFSAELRALPPDSGVVVDEIQRIPGLLNEVHRAIEERGTPFALLGSSARRLKTLGTNLLAGRAVHKQLFGFVPEELGSDFDLEASLRWGTIPIVWTSQDRRSTLEAYVQLYVREEVRGEALVRNLPSFVRFLPVAALFHGQLINVSAIARDAGTARTTVAGYLDILEDTLLAIRLPSYEAKLRVRERKHPKLYWIDPGLVRAVKRRFDPPSEEERGPLLEGWVLGLLRVYREARGLYDEVHYWAPAESRTEVDFLLRRDRDLLAIEVKAAKRFTPGLTKGLKAIDELPGLVRRILVYGGERSLETEDGIEVWTVEAFADALASDRLWP